MSELVLYLYCAQLTSRLCWNKVEDLMRCKLEGRGFHKSEQ